MRPMINDILIKIIQGVKNEIAEISIITEMDELEKFYKKEFLDPGDATFPNWEHFRDYVHEEMQHSILTPNVDLLSEYLFSGGRFDYITEEGKALLNKYETEIIGTPVSFNALLTEEVE